MIAFKSWMPAFAGMTMEMKLRKLLTIQALRGIAAVMIVIVHALHEAWQGKPWYPFPAGVDIFFVISGFIMVYTSQTWFGTKDGWKHFLPRRLIRIVPLYWLYTTLMVAVALVKPEVFETARLDLPHVLMSYFFIPHHRPAGEVQPFLSLGWTLNYEMYFYVVFAAFLFLPQRRMLIALSLFFVGSVIAGFFIPGHYTFIHFWTRIPVLEFVAGAWLAYAYLNGKRLPAMSVMLIPVLFIVLPLVHHVPTDLQGWTIQLFAIALVALAILPRGMGEWQVPEPFPALGDASYAIYLSHPFALGLVSLVIGPYVSPAALFSLCFLGGIIAGYIQYLLIEKPLLSATKKVFLRHEETV